MKICIKYVFWDTRSTPSTPYPFSVSPKNLQWFCNYKILAYPFSLFHRPHLPPYPRIRILWTVPKRAWHKMVSFFFMVLEVLLSRLALCCFVPWYRCRKWRCGNGGVALQVWTWGRCTEPNSAKISAESSWNGCRKCMWWGLSVRGAPESFNDAVLG